MYKNPNVKEKYNVQSEVFIPLTQTVLTDIKSRGNILSGVCVCVFLKQKWIKKKKKEKEKQKWDLIPYR